MADKNTIARPYAQAAFEVASGAGTLAEVSASLEIAGDLLRDGRVADYLSDPALSDADRYRFLTGLFDKAGATVFGGGNTHGNNLLKILIENDRIAVLPEIAAAFDVLKARVENTIDVTVTSASALNADQVSAITGALKSRLGRQVRLATAIDENLIGGAVIRAGDVVIDGSLRARLEGLSNALIK